jgi:hypothetical protein
MMMKEKKEKKQTKTNKQKKEHMKDENKSVECTLKKPLIFLCTGSINFSPQNMF